MIFILIVLFLICIITDICLMIEKSKLEKELKEVKRELWKTQNLFYKRYKTERGMYAD